MQSNFVLSDKEVVNVNAQATPVIAPCFVKRVYVFGVSCRITATYENLIFVSQSFYSDNKKIENYLVQ